MPYFIAVYDINVKRGSKMLKLFQPVREGTCEIVEGENEAEAGANLAARLSEAKLL